MGTGNRNLTTGSDLVKAPVASEGSTVLGEATVILKKQTTRTAGVGYLALVSFNAISDKVNVGSEEIRDLSEAIEELMKMLVDKQ